MKYLYLLLAISISAVSCKKEYEPFKYDYLLAFEIDGVEHRFENDQFLQDEANANTFSCNYNSTCPWSGNADSCMLSYMAYCHTAGREYFIMFEYRVLDDTAKLSLNTRANPQYPLHRLQVDINPLFAPKAVSFAEDNNAEGMVMLLRNEVTGVDYYSYYSPNVSNNPNYSFEFTEGPPVNGFPYADKDDLPQYLIISHANFSAVLYSAQGDSIIITNGEFRLPFCE